MSDRQTKKTADIPWIMIAVIGIMAFAAVYIVKAVLSGDSPRKKDLTTVVTLMKPPPPPPQIKEKPEIKEKPPEQVKQIRMEEVVPMEPQPADNQNNKADANQDNTPAGDNLGVDAEGAAGGDAFGLVGKKGGRSIIAAGAGRPAGFSGYIHIVETEINKRIIKRLDEEGGLPRGRLQVIARVKVDVNGTVIDHSIVGSSGNHKMDEAVEQSLNDMKIGEPPPYGKPSTLTIKIVYSVG